MSKELLDEIARLQDANDLLIANQVHIKDDMRRVINKMANIIDEHIVYDLELVQKALDRPSPKVPVALHKLELMHEQALKALKIAGR